MKTYLDYKGLQYEALRFRGSVMDFPANPSINEVYRVGGQLYLCIAVSPTVQWEAFSKASGIRYDAAKDSLAEGTNSTTVELSEAIGARSHAEGIASYASGDASHAEGLFTISQRDYSHVEGGGDRSPLDGTYTITENSTTITANGTLDSDIENYLFVVWEGQARVIVSVDTTNNSFVVDDSFDGSSVSAELSGQNSGVAYGDYSHSEGVSLAEGQCSHAEGESTGAFGEASHAEGKYTATRDYAYVGNFLTEVDGDYAHVEGIHNQASGDGSHSEGYGTEDAVVEITDIQYTEHNFQRDYTYTFSYLDGKEGFLEVGDLVKVSGTKDNVIPQKITILDTDNNTFKVSGNKPVHMLRNQLTGAAVGSTVRLMMHNQASGLGAHAEGCGSRAISTFSHAEGYGVEAQGQGSHAEGIKTQTGNNANGSHAEGIKTQSTGIASHSEGRLTIAEGHYSHAEGLVTYASNEAEHAEGKYNISNQDIPAKGGPEYVDLGLTSGTLWAKCNLGADSETEYGYYFAWGEVDPKTDYSWETYEHANGAYNKLIKYCDNANYGDDGFVDDLTVLEANDDAACVWLDGKWSIPSSTQINELLDTTQVTHAWTTDYEGTGVDGMLFTSVSNGNTLFIPAGGYYDGTSYYGDGTLCGIWANSINSNDPSQAQYSSFSQAFQIVDNSNRKLGRNIRFVRDTYPTTNTIHSIGIGREDDDKNAVEVMDCGDVYIKDVGGYDGTNPATSDTLQDTLLIMQDDINSSVKSDTVFTIWKGTQLEYDAIVAKDNNTLYIIV